MAQDNPRPRRIRLAAALASIALAAVLAACKPHPGPAPAVVTVDPEAQLQAFLVSTYGAQAKSASSWHDPVEAGGDAASAMQRSLCARQPVSVAGVPHLLLAVCGEDPVGSHATPGLIDFYVLKAGGDRLRLAASSRDQEFGNSGRPGMVSVLRLGRDFHGFRVESIWVGQGYVQGTQTLVVARGDTLVTVADFRSSFSNEGAINCEQEGDCAGLIGDLAFDLSVDGSDPSAKLYPLLIREHGQDCGQTVQREHRLLFDAATWQYPVPDALMRAGCTSDPSNAGATSP